VVFSPSSSINVDQFEEERAVLLQLQKLELDGQRLADCDALKIDLVVNLIEQVTE